MKQFCYSCSFEKKYIQPTLLKKFMPSTIQSLNCPFFNVKLCTQKNSQIEISRHVKCEKQVFLATKWIAFFLTDAPLQTIQLIQAYVSYVHHFLKNYTHPKLIMTLISKVSYHTEKVLACLWNPYAMGYHVPVH